MRALFGFLAGLTFGIGLVISGMSNPARVLNFLDIAGTWDPSLAFVMAGAAFTTYVGYHFVFRRTAPALSNEFGVPQSSRIDRKLLVGAALFGIGWGIGGYCPGPAWTGLAAAAPGTLVFLFTMLLGMAVAAGLSRGGRWKSGISKEEEAA